MKPAANRRPWHVFLCLLFLGILSGCSAGKQPAEESTPPAPVKWMEARQFFIEEWTDLLGTTQPLPDRAARITAPLEGRVISILQDAHGKPVREGQLVKQGDVLVQLDARIVQANRDKAQAAQEELKQQIQQAELAVRLADLELRRLMDLDRKQANRPPEQQMLVSPIELERARVAAEDAKSKQRGAELRAAAGEKDLRALSEQIRLYTLTSPINGRLGRVQVVTGQTLAVGTLVAEVLDIDEQIDALCFVPPAVARLLKLGQPARLAQDEQPASAEKAEAAGEDEKPKPKRAPMGKVEFIADQAELDTGNFAVKVRLPNQALRLRGNTTIHVRVLTKPGKACLTLPESAIMEDQDPPAVVVVEDYKQGKNKDGKDEESGKARKLRVKLGIRDRVLHLVEIVGLDDPEKKWQGNLDSAKFVVERGQGLRTGDPIRLEVEDEDEAPAESPPGGAK